MTVLFITRKYPPSTGGMENFSYGLISNYPGPKQTITLGKNQIHLLWFYPYALLRGIWTILTKRIDLIHLGDGVMTPLGYLLKLLTGKKVVFTAHGLDINYQNPLYQLIMPFFLRRMDHVFCVSRSTREECIKIGIPADQISVIPNGIDPQEWTITTSKAEARQIISQLVGIDLTGKKILLSVGRLSKRKGFDWFIREVLPQLPDEFVYLLIGGDSKVKGINHHDLRQLISDLQLDHRVYLLGKVDQSILKTAYRAADVFVMPNVPVEGDMEGFGIVALEAAANGLPVVASRIEGIQDAIVENTSGFFAETLVPQSFVHGIEAALTLDQRKIKNSIISRFAWQQIAVKYENAFHHQTNQSTLD